MHLIEDYRKKKTGDDDVDENDEKETESHVSFPFEPQTENISLNDSEALKLRGHNPLWEEEGQKPDDTGGD